MSSFIFSPALCHTTTFGKFSALLFPRIFFCHVPFIPLLCALFSKKLVFCFTPSPPPRLPPLLPWLLLLLLLLLLLVLLFYSLSVSIWVVSIFMFTYSFLSCVKSAGESFFMSVNVFAFPAFPFDSFFFLSSVSLLKLCVLSCWHVQLFGTPWIVAHQTPLSMEFSKQKYWSGLLFPTLGDLLDPGMESTSSESPASAGGFFTTAPLGKLLRYPSFH